jgi:cytoskeletal protein RodZ
MMFPSPSGEHHPANFIRANVIRQTLLPGQDRVGEFGDKFRKAREKKEISLDDVSNVTKISARMLRAIEEEHFDQLPGGVFNKGFIRAYAKHLGLNDEEAVTDYLACLRQAQIDAHEVWEPETPTKTLTQRESPERKRSVEPNLIASKKSSEKTHSPVQVEELPDLQLPRAEHVRPVQNNFPSKSEREIPWNILAITAIVVVLAAILWIRRSHTIGKAALNPAPAMLQTPTSAPAVPAPVPKVPVQNVGQQPNLSPANTVPARAPQAGASKATSTNSSVSATVQSSDTLAGSSDRAVKSGANEQKAATASVPRQAAPAAVKTDAPLKLVIRAEETSWISVLADGQTVSRETLIAPAHASIRATREIVVKIGNAAGVTFLWNGQEIPANGSEGEVKTFIFDANGMRAGAPAPSPIQNP